MLFNSLQFAIFFIIVFILYLCFNHKWQNRLLLIASCIFYGAWDWRFLSLIFISITTDYLCSLKIGTSPVHKKRKRLLILSVLVNLSILGFFKYFNFFSSSVSAFLGIFGLTIHPLLLKVAVPVGISFYTFKSMSYTFDVYAGKIEPTRDYLDYALFVSFFPQLLAGPIMRAQDLLPQISSRRKLSAACFWEGCYLIFWGLFQKIFIADNLAKIVYPVFTSHGPYYGAEVLTATYAFAFQIYCDFAGYSNIAIGIAKCMGFETTINFNLPYFATQPQEFWRRWHITLSMWLRDYIFVPISFAKRSWGSAGVAFALMATFLLCGLWHGAGWTYIVWGGFHGALLIMYMFLKPVLMKMPSPRNLFLKRAGFAMRMVFFFHLMCIGWLIFWSPSMRQAFNMLHSLVFSFTSSGINIKPVVLNIFSFTWLLVLVETVQFLKKDLMFIPKSNAVVQALFFAACCYLLAKWGVPSGSAAFIYYIF